MSVGAILSPYAFMLQNDVKSAVELWVKQYSSADHVFIGQNLLRALDFTCPPSVPLSAPDASGLYVGSSFLSPSAARSNEPNASFTFDSRSKSVESSSPNTENSFRSWLPAGHPLHVVLPKEHNLHFEESDGTVASHNLHRATRALLSFLVASMECLLQQISSLQSLPMILQISSEFQRAGALRQLLEKRLQSVPAHALSLAERDRRRVDEHIRAIHALETRANAHQQAAMAYAGAQADAIGADIAAHAAAEAERHANRVWAAQAAEAERQRRLMEASNAQKVADNIRQRNIDMVRAACTDLQARYAHELAASSVSGYAFLVERRGQVQTAIGLAEAEQQDRVGHIHSATVRSAADRRVHGALSRMVEDNERKHRVSVAAYVGQQDDAERDSRQAQAFFAAEEERNRRMSVRYGPRGPTALTMLERDSAIVPQFVPVDLRKRNSLTATTAAAIIATLTPSQSDGVVPVTPAAASTTPLARTKPIEASPSISHSSSSVSQELPVATPSDRAADRSASILTSTATLASTTSVADFNRTLAAHTRDLQTLRARASRVDLQHNVETERQRRWDEEVCCFSSLICCT
jgi:hypothetical protein